MSESIQSPVDSRPIPGFSSYYATADGRILSVKSKKVKEMKRFLTEITNPPQYYITQLQSDHKKRTSGYVHKFVMLAWHGPAPTNAHQTRHLDGNPLNNHKDNLCWGLPVENAADKKRHGTQQTNAGETNPRARLTDCEVRVIKKLLRIGTNRSRIREIFGISSCRIWHIASGRQWRHIA